MEKNSKSEEKNRYFFNKIENFENIFFPWRKNMLFLVLPIEEISLWPELSIPPRFRIQGGTVAP